MSLHSTFQKLSLTVLNNVRVASPCSADWDEMEGDDKVRFCAGCRLHVYNLSAMDVEEAAAKVAEHDDRVCIRFYRRTDGTVLTQDCPVGEERVRQKRRAVVFGAGSALGLSAAGVMLKEAAAVRTADAPKPDAPVPPPEPREVMMGVMAAPMPVTEVMGKMARD